MNESLKKFLAWMVVVFIGTAGPAFLVNVSNVFTVPLSTWQIIVSAGVIGLVTYGVAWALPQMKYVGIGSE